MPRQHRGRGGTICEPVSTGAVTTGSSTRRPRRVAHKQSHTQQGAGRTRLDSFRIGLIYSCTSGTRGLQSISCVREEGRKLITDTTCVLETKQTFVVLSRPWHRPLSIAGTVFLQCTQLFRGRKLIDTLHWLLLRTHKAGHSTTLVHPGSSMIPARFP